MFRNPRCTPAMANDRLHRAEALLAAATMVREYVSDEPDVAEVFVTLLFRAGVAAGEAICCRALGEHAPSDEAGVDLIASVAPEGPEMADMLAVLLRARHGEEDASDAGTRMRCRRAAERLVQAARDRAMR